jgi:hypothetical protein
MGGGCRQVNTTPSGRTHRLGARSWVVAASRSGASFRVAHTSILIALAEWGDRLNFDYFGLASAFRTLRARPLQNVGPAGTKSGDIPDYGRFHACELPATEYCSHPQVNFTLWQPLQWLRPEAPSVCNPRCVRSVGRSRRAGWLSAPPMCPHHVEE